MTQDSKQLKQWLKYSAGVVSRDSSLLREFKSDYLYFIGTTFETGCNSCFDRQYNNFINKILTMDKQKKTAYVLKLKYNGIQFKGQIYNNVDLTDANAKKLIKEHPAGIKLFDKIPEKPVKKEK